MKIPFVGPSYQTRSANFAAARCVNLFPVVSESEDSKSVAALYGTPGTRLLATLGGSGGIRGVHVPTSGGDAIVVRGGSVYRVNTSWVATLVGTVDDLSTPVSIKDNGVTAVITTGPNGYSLDLGTNVVTQISDPAFYGSRHVDFLNTYGILATPNSNVMYITGNNAITFDALDFASAESNAEPIVSHIVSHSEIVILKKTVTEVWSSSGDVDFPFAKNSNAAIEQGCAAPYSVVKMDNTVFWLGGNQEGQGIVWRLNGYTPVRVSTEAVEYAIAGYSAISDAVAYSYQQEGHTFYQLSFPTGNATWVYDANTSLWHERAYRNTSTGLLGRHRSNCHMFFGGQHVVGDWENGNLYALDLNYYSDNGSPMPAIRSGGHIASKDYSRIRHDLLQVDMETGVGLQSGQGSNPQAVLDWSDDGGKTWSNQHTASMGAVGKYGDRVRWTRLGSSRDRVYRITITDPVKRVILGASLNPKP